MVRKILLICGIASSVVYVASDILISWWDPNYSYRDQSFSELLAVGSPVRPLMIALNEFPYNLLVAAFAVGVWTSATPKRAARIAAAMQVGFAVTGMVTGVFLPMNTREALAAGEGGLRNAMHPVGTIVMSLFIVLAMGFGSRLLGRRFRYYTYATIVILVVFGGLTSLQVGQLEANEPTTWMGIEERINIYASMLWVAVLARLWSRIFLSM